MKKIKIALSIAALLGTIGVVGLSDSSVAFANEEAKKCTCFYPGSGEYGVYENNDCVVQNCYLILN